MADRAETEIRREFQPVRLPPGTLVMQAARHMRARNVSAVLVTEDNDALVGIFTERDAVSRVLAEGKDPHETTLGEVMTDNPNVVDGQISASDAIRLMHSARCRHLPIVQDSKAIGIVSLRVPEEGDYDRPPSPAA